MCTYIEIFCHISCKIILHFNNSFNLYALNPTLVIASYLTLLIAKTTLLEFT
jgi:hypothetical protein